MYPLATEIPALGVRFDSHCLSQSESAAFELLRLDSCHSCLRYKIAECEERGRMLRTIDTLDDRNVIPLDRGGSIAVGGPEFNG